MVKKTSKVLYNFGGRQLDAKSIYRRLSKRRGRAQILSRAMISVGDIRKTDFCPGPAEKSRGVQR
jgi:hypothetical protein